MICLNCRESEDPETRHELCRGGTWCDCQHAPGSCLRQDRGPDPRRGA